MYWRESSGGPLRWKLEPMICKESLEKLFCFEEGMSWRGLCREDRLLEVQRERVRSNELCCSRRNSE